MIRKYSELLPSYLNGPNIQKHAQIIEAMDKELDNDIWKTGLVLNPVPPVLIEYKSTSGDNNTYKLHVESPESVRKITVIETHSASEYTDEDFDDSSYRTVYEFDEEDVKTEWEETYTTDKSYPLRVVIETFEEHTYSDTWTGTNRLLYPIESLDILGKLLNIPRKQLSSEELDKEGNYDYSQRLQYFMQNFNTKDLSLIMLKLIYDVDVEDIVSLENRTTSIPQYMIGYAGSPLARMILAPTAELGDEIQQFNDKYCSITRPYIIERQNYLQGMYNMPLTQYMSTLITCLGTNNPLFPNTNEFRFLTVNVLYNAPFDITIDGKPFDTIYTNNHNTTSTTGRAIIKPYGLLEGTHQVKVTYNGEYELPSKTATFEYTTSGTVARKACAWKQGILSDFTGTPTEPTYPQQDSDYIDCGVGYVCYTPILDYRCIDSTQFEVKGTFKSHTVDTYYMGIGKIQKDSDGKVSISDGLIVNVQLSYLETERTFCFDWIDNVLYFYSNDNFTRSSTRMVLTDSEEWYFFAYNTSSTAPPLLIGDFKVYGTLSHDAYTTDKYTLYNMADSTAIGTGVLESNSSAPTHSTVNVNAGCGYNLYTLPKFRDGIQYDYTFIGVGYYQRFLMGYLYKRDITETTGDVILKGQTNFVGNKKMISDTIPVSELDGSTEHMLSLVCTDGKAYVYLDRDYTGQYYDYNNRNIAELDEYIEELDDPDYDESSYLNDIYLAFQNSRKVTNSSSSYGTENGLRIKAISPSKNPVHTLPIAPYQWSSVVDSSPSGTPVAPSGDWEEYSIGIYYSNYHKDELDLSDGTEYTIKVKQNRRWTQVGLAYYNNGTWTKYYKSIQDWGVTENPSNEVITYRIGLGEDNNVYIEYNGTQKTLFTLTDTTKRYHIYLYSTVQEKLQSITTSKPVNQYNEATTLDIDYPLWEYEATSQTSQPIPPQRQTDGSYKIGNQYYCYYKDYKIYKGDTKTILIDFNISTTRFYIGLINNIGNSVDFKHMNYNNLSDPSGWTSGDHRMIITVNDRTVKAYCDDGNTYSIGTIGSTVTTPYFIGGTIYNASTELIENVQVYDRVLSDTEIADLINGGGAIVNKYKVLPIQPMDNWLIVQRDSSVATTPTYTTEEELILGRSTLHVYNQELDTTKKYTIITENRTGYANFGLANSNTNPTTYPIKSMGLSNGFTTGYNKIIIEHNGTYWTATVNDGTTWTITNSAVKYIILASNVEGNSVEAMKIRTILEED